MGRCCRDSGLVAASLAGGLITRLWTLGNLRVGDAALKQAINAADSEARLEDLYLPYRPKRRTKAQIAREAGLEALAEALLSRPDQSPEPVVRRYVDASKGVTNSTASGRTRCAPPQISSGTFLRTTGTRPRV